MDSPQRPALPYTIGQQRTLTSSKSITHANTTKLSGPMQPSRSALLETTNRRDSHSTQSMSMSKSAVASKNSENVKVTVRCRPMIGRESASKTDNAWEVLPEQSKIRLAETARRQGKLPLEYSYDHVFSGSKNIDLYDASVRELVNQAMNGYHATVFAYGQTASGKTYTMVSTDAEPGVIPLAVDNVFEYIKQAVTKEFLLRVSYLEIYNESIRDLLAPENTDLKIREDRRRGFFVSPLTEEVVTSPQDVLKVIEKGEANRHISTTDYNLHSSRSHTIFQMVIESRERSSASMALNSISRRNSFQQQREATKISQLNLIDLAGSEKAVSNHDRRKEGAYINKSLLTLGIVIAKLTEPNHGNSHIPFRDSKLTRILQTALSGHAKVAVICTISPAITSLEESNNTLKFAARVKKIVISAKNDAVMDDKALIQKYRGEIVELKTKLETANDVLEREKKHTQSILSAERQQHEQQLKQMQHVRAALKERIDHLTRLILTSSSVVSHDQIASDTLETSRLTEHAMKASGQDPWSLVRNLEQQLKEAQLGRQAAEKQWMEEKRQLQEKNAQLEAELSILKTELHVMRFMTHRTDQPDSQP
ncbi:P-loop containing nucleoside triphosphate hydrolase protein [Radiomyces spectabilis]|uniref:P-loop containing nucleoside triphosphate hydrolase protein n=1 Tax=Radiomyces spectabilis TaxID=64574 RepID=UPI00222094C4|nr:P-loop containing nucleoside triphosphate hydrolase protein [Radiomyces spectabilis]KAI8377555.1 P-loop containing nucleoside triphosphate hydrolase protein [Radiomyces spectabilis]